MNPTLARAIALASLLSPAAVHALGLGDIRLNSALNQPFDAEIELVSASAEDLAALRAALASSETFGRYGLDKPAYLNDFQFRVVRGDSGRDVLRVTSPKPITEPFVTLLVEANWPRGRLLREYTVLLDPPTFANAEPAPPVAAARPPAVTAQTSTPAVTAPFATGTAPAAAAPPAAMPVEPPAPQPSPRPQPAPAPSTPQTYSGSYRVQPNDTLWRIASRVDTGSQGDVNQAMVAIYRSNPEAFDGNINLIQAGALLRLPEAGEVAAIPADAAAVEVARQYRLWQDGTGAAVPAAASTGRLRLVAPQQGGTAASTATAGSLAATAANPALEARVRELEAQLTETRRLLELQSAELANLQGRADQAAEPAAEAVTEPVGAPGAAVADAPLETEVTEPLPATASETPLAEAEPVAAPAATAQPKPAAAKPAKQPSQANAAPAATPSLIERLDPFKWPLLGGLLVALLGAWIWQRRRRGAESADESLEDTFAERSQRRASHGKGEPGEDDFTKSDILVEERRPLEPPAPSLASATIAARAIAAAPEPGVAAEAAGSAANDDSLAEADFHMAYGLYDQAAALVQTALAREPARRDLQLKLLEVWFVSGNRERFLELAGRMHAVAATAASPDWDKVIIMGRQIAPDDPLFGASVGGGALELDLEFAGTAVHMDPLVPPTGNASPDLMLGDAAPAAVNESGLDFVLDEPGRGTDLDLGNLSPTVEMPRPNTVSTVEVPQPGAATVELSQSLAPTMELPRQSADRTDEMSIDRLGLDVGAISAIGQLDHDLSEDLASTDASGIDSTAELEGIRSDTRSLDESVEDLLSTTAMLKTQTGTLSAINAIIEAGDDTGTVERTRLQNELPTVETPRVRAPAEETQLASELTAYADVSFPLSSEEASTLSEVGTKLDLARAYIDMGDPEGARSILDEVVEEGNESQQGEARRLIAALP
jgi:pilus assembly protein FimV